MKNLNHKKVSVDRFKYEIARCPYFRQGYEDALKNREFDYSISHRADSARYERGRAFACFCKMTKQPRTQWRKNIMAKTAQDRVILAYVHGYII